MEALLIWGSMQNFYRSQEPATFIHTEGVKYETEEMGCRIMSALLSTIREKLMG